ncbi:MAG TPA: rRNA maturation RNase YbeY [Nitrospirae bacterium]|nr:rRNA maturation RNase YbeY [Nitrospirota bacterium]
MPVRILTRIATDSKLKTGGLKIARLERRIAFILKAAIEAGATRAARAVGPPGGAELSVALIGDSEMRQLNLDYRGVDRPTDVLAFSQTEGEFGDVAPDMLGDVVVSVDTALRQADQAGLALEEELDLLIIHGVLHLLGYDHEKGADEEKKMKGLENEVLSALNEADNLQ